jgi:hypothetical protein
MQIIQILRLPSREVAANFTLEFQEFQVTAFIWMIWQLRSLRSFHVERTALAAFGRFSLFGYHVVSASNKRPLRGDRH